MTRPVCALAFLAALLPLAGCASGPEPGADIVLSKAFPMGDMTRPGHEDPHSLTYDDVFADVLLVNTSHGNYVSSGALRFTNATFGVTTFWLNNNTLHYGVAFARPHCTATVQDAHGIRVVRAGFNGTLTEETPLVEVHARAPCRADFYFWRPAS